MVNKSKVVERIAELVKRKIIDGILFRDESNMQGIKSLLNVKRCSS